ncbi:porin family protein [Photobacterium sp. WH24]|uniref:porin family protein n=1 Tax=Photobacterium TaxID=657 RepID=UPI001C461AB1|nr:MULTISPECIES: porin family protein [Photobacterium]MBV7260569.1 porin family protein [Photobacterium sp. WH24]
MFKLPSILMLSCLPLTVFANPHDVSPLVISANPTFYLYGGTGTLGFDAKKSTGTSIDKQHNFTAGIGHDFSPYIALEGSYQYLLTEIETAELRTSQVGLSLIPSTGELGNSRLKLFARLAVNLTDVECKGCSSDFSENGLTFDAGLGVQWDINHRFQLRGEYISSIEQSSLNKTFKEFELDGFQLSLGYRY